MKFHESVFYPKNVNAYFIKLIWIFHFYKVHINYYWWSIALPLMLLTALLIGVTKLDFMLIESGVSMLRAKFLRYVMDIVWHEWWNHNIACEILQYELMLWTFYVEYHSPSIVKISILKSPTTSLIKHYSRCVEYFYCLVKLVAGISEIESMTIDTPTAQIHTIHWFKQSEKEMLN
jgi:hypothetical protein